MKSFLNIVKYFTLWRLALALVVALSIPLSQNLSVFSNFDGLKYINIAVEGYGTPKTFYSYLLFPLYPLLIRGLSSLFGYLESSLLISHIFAIGSLYLFQKLANLDYSSKVVKASLLALLVFPSSFFLVSAYSESLFLFLCLLSVYLSRKQFYFLSGVVAALASYTRLAGLLLWVLLALEYWENNKNNLKKLFSVNLISLLLPPLGAIYYLNYLQLNSSNIQRFMLSLPDKFVFLHQVIFRYFKMIVFVNHSSSLFWVVLTECLVGLFGLYVLIISFRKIRFSYWFFLFISFFIPTLWGNLVSMPRYLLVAFPIFLFIGKWLEDQKALTQRIYFSASILLLIINLYLFVNGIFVG